MLTLKRLVFCVVFASMSLPGVLEAADSRLLVVSIQLPPPGVTDSLISQDAEQRSAQKIGKWGSLRPEKFAKKMIKGLVPSNALPLSPSGIVGMYGGYYGYSDHSGHLTFPLRHNDPQVDVIFTPSIDLEALYKETYSGIFVNKKTMDAQGISDSMAPTRYLFSLKITPTASSGAVAPKADPTVVPEQWVVTKSAVALDTRLPQAAVIILINPRNMFVPLGRFATSSKPHLVLPGMYLIGKKFNDAVLLNNLAQMKYFEEIVIADGTVVNKNVTIQQSAVMND